MPVQPVEVRIADSQEGMDYRLVHLREGLDGGSEEIVLSESDVRGVGRDIILRSEPVYVHAPPPPDSRVVRVRVPSESVVQVRRPMVPETWQDPADYDPAGDARPGNGGALEIGLAPLDEDTLVIVQAVKEHQVLAGRGIPSSIQLEQPALVLVRPNPVPALKLSVMMEGDKNRW